jgi:hypothetical protein
MWRFYRSHRSTLFRGYAEIRPKIGNSESGGGG